MSEEGPSTLRALTEEQVWGFFSETETVAMRMDKEMYAERLYWLSNHRIPSLHCDDLLGASGVLSIPHDRWLTVDEATRVMLAVESNHADAYTRIAIQKMLVIRTLFWQGLPPDLFSVGLCYYGPRQTLHSRMEPENVRSIVTGVRWCPPPPRVTRSGGGGRYRDPISALSGGGAVF